MPIKTIVYKPDVPEDKKLTMIPEGLPKPCFRWLFISQSGAGKTNVIKNVIFNNKKNGYCYGKYFDELYIYVGTKDDYKEYQRLVQKLPNFYCILFLQFTIIELN